MEKMLWEAFVEDNVTEELSWIQFHRGLRAAIQSINVELKRPYDKAVSHRDQQYESVVWATAAGDDLYRPLKDMYDSYKEIVKQKNGPNEYMLAAPKFNNHIRNLRSKGFGEILQQVPNRSGWYVYKEKMLRGYVRMQAEANEIELLGETEAPSQRMYTPGNARTGYHGSTIPRGIQYGRKIR